MISRRSVLFGLVAAPIVCRPALLMLVKDLAAKRPPLLFDESVVLTDGTTMLYVAGLSLPLFAVGDTMQLNSRFDGNVTRVFQEENGYMGYNIAVKNET